MHALPRLAAFDVLAGFGLNACSAASYKTAVQTFAAGVDALDSSAQTYATTLATLHAAQRDAAYSQQRAPLQLTRNCYIPTSPPPCDIMLVSAAAVAPPGPTAAELASAQTALQALKAYATALQAIETASTTVDISAAGQSISALLTQLQDKQAAAIATPSASVLGDLFGLYLEHLRYQALRDAVVAVGVPPPGEQESVIATLARSIAALLGEYQNEEYVAYQQAADAASQPLGAQAAHRLTQAQYADDLKRLESSLTPLQQSLKADPKGAVQAMLSAHQALVTAVQTNAGQTLQLLATVGQFATAASKLAAAAETTPAPASQAGKPSAKPAAH